MYVSRTDYKNKKSLWDLGKIHMHVYVCVNIYAVRTENLNLVIIILLGTVTVVLMTSVFPKLNALFSTDHIIKSGL